MLYWEWKENNDHLARLPLTAARRYALLPSSIVSVTPKRRLDPDQHTYANSNHFSAAAPLHARG